MGFAENAPPGAERIRRAGEDEVEGLAIGQQYEPQGALISARTSTANAVYCCSDFGRAAAFSGMTYCRNGEQQLRRDVHSREAEGAQGAESLKRRGRKHDSLLWNSVR